MIVYHYLTLARAFGWTPGQIDDMELEMFWDLLIVAEKAPKDGQSQQGYIDQVL